MASNKDSAANKGSEKQRETNTDSSRWNPNSQEERPVTPNRPTGSFSRLEIGGPSSVSAPFVAAATEIRDSSTVVTTTALTTPSVPVRVRRSGVAGKGSSRRTSRKANENSPAPNKAKGEMNAPDAEPICSYCGKNFAKWKAVFGHMRVHRDRGWKGAFPPPTWSPNEKTAKIDQTALQNELAPTLLNLAKETLDKMNQYQIEAGSSRREISLDFDLNSEPAGIFERNSGSSPPSVPPRSGARDFDLNLRPENGNNGNERSSNES